MPQQYVDFAYVKENASFERVIACYNLKLLGTGAQRSVLCPFHRERRPSCKIELELGLGDGTAGYLTSDLSYDYVRINADYRT